MGNLPSNQAFGILKGDSPKKPHDPNIMPIPEENEDEDHHTVSAGEI